MPGFDFVLRSLVCQLLRPAELREGVPSTNPLHPNGEQPYTTQYKEQPVVYIDEFENDTDTAPKLTEEEQLRITQAEEVRQFNDPASLRQPQQQQKGKGKVEVMGLP